MSGDPKPGTILERRSTASRAAQALREELLAGAFPPGAAMRDVELALRFGVSRPTMREALMELARDGLLVHSLHRGMEVTSPSAADVHELYEARKVLEVAGLRRLLASDSAAEELWVAVDAMHHAERADDLAAGVEADMWFHATLVAALANRRLQAAEEAALAELRLVLSVTDRATEGLDRGAGDHAALLEAFASGSEATAVIALVGHLDRSAERVVAVLPDP